MKISMFTAMRLIFCDNIKRFYEPKSPVEQIHMSSKRLDEFEVRKETKLFYWFRLENK